MLLFVLLNNNFLYANLNLRNILNMCLYLIRDDVVFLFLNLVYTIIFFFKIYINCYFTSDGNENNIIRIIERKNVILCLLDIDIIFL